VPTTSASGKKHTFETDFEDVTLIGPDLDYVALFDFEFGSNSPQVRCQLRRHPRPLHGLLHCHRLRGASLFGKTVHSGQQMTTERLAANESNFS
jgi:hypothetical protein